MLRNGVSFPCTDIKTGAPADSLSIAFAEYDNATRTFNAPLPLNQLTSSGLSLGSQATLVNTPGTNLCTSKTFDNVVQDNVVRRVGDLALRNGIIEINGRDDRQGTLASPSRVQLALFPFAGLLETGPAGVNYASAATVSGCEKCHTVPYLKHGFIYGRVGGDNATDFYTCKGCHNDKGDGGHQIWQLLVDNPQRAASFEAAGETGLTPAETAKYAYKKRLMNDVHMSHAMEFAYPQSMTNCATCHEGKLAATLTDNNFTIETCKSCHPVTGGTDLPSKTGAFTVDTRTPNPLLKQAPALASILPPGLSAHAPPFATACSGCHATGGIAPVFGAIHTGYDKLIYGDAIGTKYSTAITAIIDNVSYVDNTNTLKFGFHTTGSLGGLTSTKIVPTILVGLYGFDTKDYLFGPHESEGSPSKRLLEFSTATPAPSSNSTRITVAGGAGTWNVTANLSTWKGWIDNGSVKRVEVAVLPTLLNADNVVVALNAPSKTFNLKTKALEPAFFGNSIVKVPAGRISTADPSMSGCNNCHDALATTFHTPDRGGNIVVCRLCHITKASGSHLELQSRSIDSYIHAIHRFQDFDTGAIDFTDPVEAMEYTHHVESNFPTFGIEDCRACHNAGKFNVPNQGLSMPGVLSNTDFGTIRNIGTIDNDVITGPATRACGACHRAEAIIANAGAGDPILLANLNSHMTTFGYMIKTPPATIMDVIVKVFASFGDNGTILVDVGP
jgi:OmcA/MtrC family decaheme c-type cytochrome